MAQRDNDYDLYATPDEGRLFNNAMMGFNKEEVLSYLEEMTDEQQNRQDNDRRRIQDLTFQINELQDRLAQVEMNPGMQGAGEETLYAQLEQQHQYIQQLTAQLEEANARLMQPQMQGGDPGLYAQLEQQQQYIQQLSQELEFAHANAPIADPGAPDLHLLQEQMQTLENENAAWQAEYQKAEQHIFELRSQVDQLAAAQAANPEMYQQLDAATQEMTQLQQLVDASNQDNAAMRQQLDAAHQEITAIQQQLEPNQQEIATLRQQLEEAWNNLNYYKDMMGNEAMHDAQQAASSIISDANAEAARIRDAATAEKERLYKQIRTSAGGLSESIFNLRTEIADVEGGISHVLENVQHTLVNVLSALAQTEQDLSTFTVQVERFPFSSPAVTKTQATTLLSGDHSMGNPFLGGQSPQPDPRRDDLQAAKRDNVRAFRPTYSNSPNTGGSYWSHTSEALQPSPETSQDARLRDLSESLVDTLRQMMN